MRGTATDTSDLTGGERRAADEAERKRAAVELVVKEGEALRRSARRYSLCAEDAEDAYQRALEILLKKAPAGRPRELLAWTKTVVKHEALAVRRSRERLLGPPPPTWDEDVGDWAARLPSPGAGPSERLERRDEIARSREAIRALKPAERRALTLLAAGYSYAEISEITGFSPTKVNRSLAEGRERFRRIVASSEDGSRCTEMRPLLSAFCDSEAGSGDAAKVREHLRACGSCRAIVRAYRAAPATVAALCPLPLEMAKAVGAKGSEAIAGAKSGGLPGLGKLTGLYKAAALCAAAGTAAGVAAGMVPLPSGPADRVVEAGVERVGERIRESWADEPTPRSRDKRRRRVEELRREEPAAVPAPVAAAPATPEPLEAPSPPPAPAETSPPAAAIEPAPSPAPSEADGAAGEFGP